MRASGGAEDSLRRLRDATSASLHPLTTLLFTLFLLFSLVTAESTPASSLQQQYQEWGPPLPRASPVTVGADGLATSRGAGRRRSDGLSITRSIPVETGIAADAAVDDQAIKFTPARIDLGRMETCSPQRFHVGVENRGRVSVRLDGADFTHEGFSLANDVRGIRLDPGDRFNVQFVFLPSDVEPNGVDAHLRVLTTSGLFSLPIGSPEVALNRYGVSGLRASIPAGVRFGQSLQFVNPLDYAIRITEIYAMDSFVHLELLNGSNWIGPRYPREADDNVVAKEIPGKYDQQFDYARRAERGAWDMPTGTTSPLVKVSLHSNTPGVYSTYIHVAAGDRRLLLIPVRITVLKPGIHIEPKELDLGVLTDLHETETYEVLFTVYNAGVNPIDILELKVLETNLIVSAQLWGGSTVIPPRTQVLNALAVQLRVDKARGSGPCFASLLLKTNASSSELGQRKLKLYGQVLRGKMAFQINETRVGVVMPLENVFYDGEGVNDTDGEIGDEETAEDQEIGTTKLVSIVGENSSMGVMAGTSALRKLRLWNRFDCPVELQRVWVDSPASDQDDLREVSVYKFKQGAVPAGSAWPKISLQITPTEQGKTIFAPARSYSLVVETNVTLHRIPINVYYGFLDVNSTRGLQRYAVSGYNTRDQNSSCLVVPRGGLVTTTSPRIDGGEVTTDTQAAQICRALLFDLEKVASHRSRTEVVKLTNENPVPVTMTITSVPQSASVDISISTDVFMTHSVVSPDVTLYDFNDVAAEAAGYWDKVVGRNSTHSRTRAVLIGNQFVIQPGYQVVFHVKIQAKDTLGELTVPVMSVETPVEVLHLHARLRSVQGTVEPVTPAIVLPSMFPGRTKVIHLHYRNTFEHSVTPLMATITSSNLKLLSMRDAMAPKQVECVLDLLFSPAADAKCSDALFLADCLMPVSAADQTCEQLSDYGELVDEHDLAALSRRDEFWSRTQGSERQSTVEAQVLLQTDIMEDVAKVTIKALLERPAVTALSTVSLHQNNDSSNALQRKEFELTELLDRSQIFVNVQNPSNISIQMELTIAEADQGLFYSCREEMGTREEPGKTNKGVDSSETISPLCLAEWTIATADAIAQERDKQADIEIPPFYFRKRVVQVPAGKEATLGPIYYLPSKAQEVTTTVFVRNDLSHIEPVQLFARSGKGTLDVLVDIPTNDNKPSQPRFITMERDTVTDQDGPTVYGNPLEYDGALRFALTQLDEPTDYIQSAAILLSNTGPFALTIHRVAVERYGDSSWIMTQPSDAAQSNEFVVTLKDPRPKDDKGNLLVLHPGETARFSVSFCASCFTSNVTSWLFIDTSDTIKRIRLQGTITMDAAFSCLRSRMSPSLRYAFHSAWIIAAAVAVLSTLYTILMLGYDAWTLRAIHKVQSLNIAVDTENTTEMTVPKNNEDLLTPNVTDDKATSHTLGSLKFHLDEMERAAFARLERVVTPAVTELLEKRHKGLRSSVRSSPHPVDDQFLEGEQPTRRENNAVSATRAETNSVIPFDDAERILPSDAASTATELNLRDAQNENEVTIGNADSSSFLSLTSDPLPVIGAPDATAKPVEGNNNNSSSDLPSEERSSESSEHLLSSSSSSSNSPTIQPDAEESSRGGDFPTLSFRLPDDQLKSTLGFDLPMAAPHKAEGPFEAFRSLSERWRAHDRQDSKLSPLSGNFSGIGDWNGTLSLNTLGQGFTGLPVGNHHEESIALSRSSDPGSLIGSTSGLYNSVFAAPAVEAPNPTAKKAPPGFTPADAKPLEARAAFERLRSGEPGATTDGFGGRSLFASKLPLFGSALPPKKSDEHVPLGSIGRIGSGRSKVLRGLDDSSDTTT